MKSLEMKIPPLLLLCLFMVLAGLVAAFSPSAGQHLFADSAQNAGALVLAGVGVYFALQGVRQFKKANTTINPIQAEKASALVTTGVYSRTRNPMYLGFVLVLAAWCLALGVMQSLWVLPVFALYLNELQIKPEERILRSKYPREFSDYCSQVGRWWS